jgi:hypothetical protein
VPGFDPGRGETAFMVGTPHPQGGYGAYRPIDCDRRAWLAYDREIRRLAREISPATPSSLEGICAEIARLMTMQEAPKLDSKYAQRKQEDALGFCSRRLRALAERAFGRPRGWKPSETAFSARALTHGEREDDDCSLPHDAFDHPVYYRRGGKPAAIVSQPYNYDRWKFDKVARELGLSQEKVEGSSWHCPGRTTLAAWTAKEEN